MSEEKEPLADYDEESMENHDVSNQQQTETAKGSYVGHQSAGFRDFLLRPELLRAIGDCGFEHPSEVQQECIPHAMLGMDLICQAKSGMGKTAVFVLAVLQQIEPIDEEVHTLVLCHTRELAYQICQEFERFGKYYGNVRTIVLFGGIPESQHKNMLKEELPHIVVGTPGRVCSLVEQGVLKLDKLKCFILDECDRMLEALDMRKDVQRIFKHTPHEKQVMMFSATIPKDTRNVCRKFAKNPREIFVDNEGQLTLHGLQQYFCKITESDKTRKLFQLIDDLDFNQVVIFVRARARATELNRLLNDASFPSVCTHGGREMKQQQRIEIYRSFKQFKARILVTTDLFGRGVDIERVNIVINYDMSNDDDTYLHRVGRAGRFGTKGLAITFISSSEDSDILEKVQKRFEVDIKPLPDTIDSSTYMTAS